MLSKTKTLKKEIRLFILCVLFFASARSQHSEIDSVVRKVDSLLYLTDFEQAQRLTLEYINIEGLSDEDWFKINMMYGEVIRSSARPRKAILSFKEIAEKLPHHTNRELYLSRIYMSIASCYFDIKNYKLAGDFAQRSISASPDSSLSAQGHAVNYLILGFVNFLTDDYQSSRENYQRALNLYKRLNLPCELPLVYTKLARLESRFENHTESDSLLQLCDSLNHICDVEVYKILVEETRYEIYKQAKDFEKALQSYIKINDMKGIVEYDIQQAELVDLELAHEKDMQFTELMNLRKLNAKNAEIARKKGEVLTLTIVLVLGFAFLSMLLAKINFEKRKANRELLELNEELESRVAERTAFLVKANKDIKHQSRAVADRSKRLMDFYHLVTHDLRAPIANLIMLLKLYEAVESETEKQKFYDTMLKVLQSLSETVDRTLEKTNSDELKYEEFRTDKFSEILASVKKGLSAQIQSLDAQIETDFSEAPTVFFSPNILQSIFHNLLSNSLKYSHPERIPRIHISSYKDESGVVLRIEDNGIGMDLENQSELLFSKHGTFHKHPDAKGVGLHYLREKIIQSGGSIWAESQLGIGSTFFVKFRE
jgi:signal transduction histidine kinase